MTSESVPLHLQKWDVIVVGTGPGGGALGHALASAGRKVLFCDAGGPLDGSMPPHQGRYPELDPPRNGEVLTAADAELLRSAGRYFSTVVDTSHAGRPRSSVPFLGAGPGGSSALYGMAMERFAPEDFHSRTVGQADASADLAPLEWPITYDELAPYYSAAERLFGVRGDVDPLLHNRVTADQHPDLLPPRPLSAAASEFADHFRSRGMHPYRLPVANAGLGDCDACQSYLCARKCKYHAFNRTVEPALAKNGAAYLGGCQVTDLVVEGKRVTKVRARRGGEDIELRAPLVVLAAGALQTPSILLRSRSTHFPDGLGNHSDLVGRCLMRHFVDLYVVKSPHGNTALDPRQKELAFNDLYLDDGVRLGTFQSFGSLPPPPMLMGSLKDDVSASRFGWAAPLLPLARPILLPVLANMFQGAMIFATIAEDLPYKNHRVQPRDPTSLDVDLSYTVRPEGARRIARFRQRVGGLLKGRSWRLLAQAENNERMAHVCGTCRFGDDPATSVLDRNNKVHGVDNVFVVDGSFFPTSGGTNPSLTIAANALRVGEWIVKGMPS